MGPEVKTVAVHLVSGLALRHPGASAVVPVLDVLAELPPLPGIPETVWAQRRWNALRLAVFGSAGSAVVALGSAALGVDPLAPAYLGAVATIALVTLLARRGNATKPPTAG